MESTLHKSEFIEGRQEILFLGYNVGLAVVFAYLLVALVVLSYDGGADAANSSSQRAAPPAVDQASVAGAPAAAPSELITSTGVVTSSGVSTGTFENSRADDAGRQLPSRPAFPADLAPRLILLSTLLTLAVAGGTGGVLCNLRGIFRWYSDKKAFPHKYVVPFVVRPWMGCLVGLLFFFLANLLNAAFADPATMTWTTFRGRLPYIGLALLAGFASQEFMQRMKATARAAFDQPDQPDDQPTIRIRSVTSLNAESAPPAFAAGDETLVMYGLLDSSNHFTWRIFDQPQSITPTGEATAVIIAGGTQDQRNALAQQAVEIAARQAKVEDWLNWRL